MALVEEQRVGLGGVDDGLLPVVVHRRLGGRHHPRAHLHALGAERERGGHGGPVDDAAGGDDRHVDPSARAAAAPSSTPGVGLLKPPPSPPSTTSPSTPASTALSAADSVGTTWYTVSPAALRTLVYFIGDPADVVTNCTPWSMTNSAMFGSRTKAWAMLTPNGLSVRSRIRRISSFTASSSPEDVSMIPQAPARETAEASWLRAIQPIGAWTIGTSTPRARLHPVVEGRGKGGSGAVVALRPSRPSPAITRAWHVWTSGTTSGNRGSPSSGPPTDEPVRLVRRRRRPGRVAKVASSPSQRRLTARRRVARRCRARRAGCGSGTRSRRRARRPTR